MAKFNRITLLNLCQGMQGILTETANGSVTRFVAIPSIIFFPDYSFTLETPRLWRSHISRQDFSLVLNV